jgi:hypothetical protein
MRCLLITPPMVQLNTPYPATPFLTGHLRGCGYDVVQADASLELALRLFSPAGLRRILAIVQALPAERLTPALEHFLENADDHLATISAAVRFLQDGDPTLAVRIAARNLLPEGLRFAAVDEELLGWAFGSLGTRDRARHLASLYIDDLADVIREGVDPRFSLARYAEQLAANTPSFAPLQQALESADPTLIDTLIDELAAAWLQEYRPDVVGFTVPFPGNLYGSLRMARAMKRCRPGLPVVLGGGYAGTELRSLKDTRIFDYADFIVLDVGERPLECILEHLKGKRSAEQLLRTFVRRNGEVEFISDPEETDIRQRHCGAPTLDGLPLDRYIGMAEMLNPMHRLWTDGRWNKLLLAHGCYWGKCAFCDTSLDYIRQYDPLPAPQIVDRMEKLIAETGQTGFHFVDEAAPPALLQALSAEILRRQLTVSWWTNIRFEKSFTPELVRTMTLAGCIGVSGGLEAASDRLLKILNKGVTVEQATRVAHAFAEHDVLVHAYLMYGVPGETDQETVDCLERVRQLFAAGCLHSAYWHRFAATIHSPIGQDLEMYGLEPCPPPATTFGINEIHFTDPKGGRHGDLGPGLHKAVYNYMHGSGLELPIQTWFDLPVPKTTVPANLIGKFLQSSQRAEKSQSGGKANPHA